MGFKTSFMRIQWKYLQNRQKTDFSPIFALFHVNPVETFCTIDGKLSVDPNLALPRVKKGDPKVKYFLEIGLTPKNVHFWGNILCTLKQNMGKVG